MALNNFIFSLLLYQMAWLRMAIMREHLRGMREWASEPLRGGTGCIMTPNLAQLWAALKRGMGWRLMENRFDEIQKICRAMKDCPRKSEMGCRITKEKNENMSCE